MSYVAAAAAVLAAGLYGAWNPWRLVGVHATLAHPYRAAEAAIALRVAAAGTRTRGDAGWLAVYGVALIAACGVGGAGALTTALHPTTTTVHTVTSADGGFQLAVALRSRLLTD